MNNYLSLKTVDELHRAIMQQRSVTRTVTLEIDAVVRFSVSQGADDDERLAAILVERETSLLAHYASLPTLLEQSKSPDLRGAMQAGATFGVVAIVAEVILADIRALCSDFVQAHRLLFMVMLREIYSPRFPDESLAAIFVRSMKIETSVDLSGDLKKTTLQALLEPLASAMLTVAEHLSLIEYPADGGYSITPLGLRTLLHLDSAQLFIEEVAGAHTRLQAEIGRVSPPKSS